MHVRVKITISDDEGRFVMGGGLVALLDGIELRRSIRAAAREMDLSYPKALRMIQNMERGLGEQVVLRRKGGCERGGAELTQLGREFLSRYKRVHSRVSRFASASVERELAKPLVAPAARRTR
jgi:molybdate transport system regulatory protein